MIEGWVRLGWAVFDEWRKRKPERQARRLERKNRRRAKKGLPPLEPEVGGNEMDFLAGYKTYIGIAVLVLTPIAAKYGFTDADVQTWVTAGGTLIGGIIAVVGRMFAKPKA